MVKFKQICFEVCGACQHDCIYCAHSGMRSVYPDYQLTIDELKKFIDYTKISGYFFESIAIHGIGEPLLWSHFDEGIDILKKSGIGGKILVTTNGLLLNKIKDQTWENIDILGVSVYPAYPMHELLKEKKEKYKDKIEIRMTTTFKSKPIREYHKSIPCFCICQGPMFVKDKIFLYCGPPAFDAAKLAHMDISKSRDLCVELKPNYLDNFDKTKTGNIELCNYCWANASLPLPVYPYGYVPLKQKVVVDTFRIIMRRRRMTMYVQVLKFLRNFPVVYELLRKIYRLRSR